MDSGIQNFNSPLGLNDSQSDEQVDDRKSSEPIGAETDLDDSLIPESNLHVEIAFADGINEVDLGNSSTYMNPVPRLEDMAIIAVALPLRNTYMRIERQYGLPYVTGERRIRKMNEVVDQLNMPKSILNKIRCITYNIQVEDAETSLMSNMHFLYQICDCVPKESIPYWSYCARQDIVWNPNGTIDYTKTISKVFSCTENCAGETDKMFEVIANFCLEKHLNEFSIDSLSEEYILEARPGTFSVSYPLDYYWIEYRKKNQDFQNAHSTLLQALRDCSNSSIIWPVYEYFWNSFDENDQIAIVQNLMSEKRFQRYQMNLFSKLNRNQLRILYSKERVNIISNFIYSREFAVVRAAWRCVRHLIKGPQFKNIIDTFSDEAKKTGDYVDSLIDIWNSAPSTLIEYMLNEKNFELAENYFSINRHNKFIFAGGFKVVKESLKFLAAVLGRAKVEVTMKYLVNKGPFIIQQYGTNVFNSLIVSVSSVNDQQEKIKEKTLLKIINLDSSYRSKIILNHFRMLCIKGQEELDEFLKFFTTKLDLQMKLRSKLIPFSLFDLNGGYFDANDWANVSNVIDQVYPDENQSRKKKKEIIFSSLKENHTLKQPFLLCFWGDGEERFNELDQILTPILTEDEMIKFKEHIITNFRAQLFNDRYCPFIRHIRMDRFVHWCFSGNIDKMSRFKSRFPIRKAFHIIFAQIVRKYTAFTSGPPKDIADLSFAPLNALLRWKFPSKVRRYEFKEKQILNIVNDTSRVMYLWKDYDDELEKIIQWVFGGIEWKIENFNQTYDDREKKLIIMSCNVIEISDGCEEYYNYRSDLCSD